MNIAASVLMAVLILLSMGTMGAVESGTLRTDSSPTEITECTVIEKSGHYVLTENLTRDDPGSNLPYNSCIVIQEDNVTFDGNGHSIVIGDEFTSGITIVETHRSGDQPEPPTNVTIRNVRLSGPGGFGPSIAISVRDLATVTIRNVTVADWGSGIEFEAADSRISNVTVTRSAMVGIDLAGRNVTLRDSTISETQLPSAIHIAVGLADPWDVENVTVVNNTLRRNLQGIEARQVSNLTISNNTVSDAAVKSGYETDAMRLSGSNITVAGNTVRNVSAPGQGGSVSLAGSDITVAENTIRNVSGQNGVRIAVHNSSENGTRVVGNTVADVGGKGVVLVESTFEPGGLHNIRIADNRLVDSTTGVQIGSTGAAGPFSDVENVTIVDNVATDTQNGIVVYRNASELTTRKNDVSNNSQYGVLNHDNTVLNATHNYWGEGGPSSPSPETLQDPVTCAQADGNGSAVSEGAIKGVSNVYFDPWLDQTPTNTTDNQTDTKGEGN